ncbi:non-specific lipid-transfer protein AP10-like [Rhododendron vialii]|uniref:non-specific lipid-transfer protein AP10-like n=1 Tax=Rhododendron vialii TaxID=182163 RepID=UPI00265F4E60|nr:non-specific lipid-transfer protein AP10-like [Rhododendron vialii]
MKSSSQAVPLMAILMLVLLVSPSSVAAITCGDVLRNISPCVSYLISGSGMPPPPCCAGAKALAASCTTTADRQTACGCIKTASKSLNVKPALAKALPGNCQINLGFTVDPNIDCSTIS